MTGKASSTSQARFLSPSAVSACSEDEIAAVELKTGIRFQQLDTTNKNLADTKSILDGVVDEIERADTFEAVAVLNQVQNQPEASYTTAVRVSSLSLTKFLQR